MNTDEMVIDVIACYGCVNKKGIKPEMSITDDLHLDSLDFAEMVIEIEQGLEIEIEDEDVLKWKTVADIQAYCRDTQDATKKRGE